MIGPYLRQCVRGERWFTVGRVGPSLDGMTPNPD